MIGIDKQLHFFSGGLLSGVLFVLVGLWWALAGVAAVAIAKEGYDYLHRDKHTPDGYDALATMFGACPLVFAVMITEFFGSNSCL